MNPKFTPETILRTTLGVMYLYSGFDLMIHPGTWVWALPYWLRELMQPVIDVLAYIRIQGFAEIIFALILLAWFLPRVYVKWVAILSTLEFAGILILAFIPWSTANFLTTFRDIGLLGASLA